MALKLTLLLLAGIFLVMFFAPAAPPPAPRAPDRAPETATPAPTAPAPTLPRAAPVEPPPVAALPRAATPAPLPADPRPAPADPAATDPSLRADDAPLTLPGLVIGTTGGDAAQALSLSEAVRQRAEAAQNATDTLLQDLVNTPESDPLPQPTDPIPPPQETLALVTGDSVNLRAGPSTANAVVGQVDFGQELVLTGPFVDGWASVINPVTGQEAFMASRFLQVQP